ncbi:MAG: T9SS type A sorting domain-containing protein [Bacteroidia bacterium]
MKKQFLLFFSFIFSLSYSQNLVPNPSFEEYSSCPTSQCGISLATGWYSAGYTPDYYNTCASWPFGVPGNAAGYQFPSTGNAYVGIGTYSYNLNTREYIITQLNSPLEGGIKYYVSFKASSVDHFLYCANNKLGALFSTVSYKLGSDSCNSVAGLTPHNFAHVYTNQIITDTSSWVTVSGSFVADSAYQYIIIGNHFDDFNTDTICFNSNAGGIVYGGGYYIDDIYVSTDSTLSITESKTVQDVSVYPTITNNRIIVKTNTPTKTNIKIYDLLGRLITTQTLIQLGENEIELTEFNAGIYNLIVIIDNKQITKKIILNK